MYRGLQALTVIAVAALGIWGCSQGPIGTTAAERLRSLENKSARLEDDLRTAQATRDQFKRKFAAAEETTSQLRSELDKLQGVLRERDELASLLRARTGERDFLDSQFGSFRTNIKDLLGRTEAALSKTPDGTGIAATTPIAPAPIVAAEPAPAIDTSEPASIETPKTAPILSVTPMPGNS